MAGNVGQAALPASGSARETRGGSVRGTIGAVRSAASRDAAAEPASAGGNPSVDKQLAPGASAGGTGATVQAGRGALGSAGVQAQASGAVGVGGTAGASAAN
jgi:hypothetical protein